MKIAAILCISVLWLNGCLKNRTPCVYEIPEGFTGWVLIEFERSDAAALPKKDGKLVFQIGPDGRLSTSSKLEDGWAADQYFYVGPERRELKQTGWGSGGMIWAGSTGTTQTSGRPQRIYANFFVGTEEAFKAAQPHPRPE